MIAYDEGGITVHLGDCREVLATLPDASIDAVVTDPPYELGFMGKTWDRSGIAFDPGLWAECLRILKPGGHLVAFGGTRTFHRIAVAIEDGGFEIRDTLSWLYGSGFPKSKNLAGDWQGWGTALKPGWEPIILARKPLIGTVAANVTEHGTGALNIDGCRIEGAVPTTVHGVSSRQGEVYGTFRDQPQQFTPHDAGRWPANVVIDEAAAELLDQQSGITSTTGQRTKRSQDREVPGTSWGISNHKSTEYPDDFGGASRFYYTAKASRSERNAGLGDREAKSLNWSSGDQNPGSFQSPGTNRSAQNHHPTVKPLALMRWLVRLVTPPGGVICDPFGGSGTTAVAGYQEGFRVVLIEREPEYVEIEIGRIRHAQKHGRQARLDLEDAA